MFYCFFHLWLNILAELLCFGDREFIKIAGMQKQLRSVEECGTCFKVTAVIEDVSDEGSAIIMGKQDEELFRTTCEDLITKKNYRDPKIPPPETLQTQGQIKLLQLKPGNAQNFIMKGVFYDSRPFTPTQETGPASSTPDQVSSTKKRKFLSVSKQLFTSMPNENQKSDSPTNENDAADMMESPENTSE